MYKILGHPMDKNMIFNNAVDINVLFIQHKETNKNYLLHIKSKISAKSGHTNLRAKPSICPCY